MRLGKFLDHLSSQARPAFAISRSIRSLESKASGNVPATADWHIERTNDAISPPSKQITSENGMRRHWSAKRVIAQFEKVVVDVLDLDAGLQFRGTLTGLQRGYVDPAGKFMGLGQRTVDGSTHSVILLQEVDHVQSGGSTHIDLKVCDVKDAIRKIEATGGKIHKEPAFYPDAETALLEWDARPLGYAVLHYTIASMSISTGVRTNQYHASKTAPARNDYSNERTRLECAGRPAPSRPAGL